MALENAYDWEEVAVDEECSRDTLHWSKGRKRSRRLCSGEQKLECTFLVGVKVNGASVCGHDTPFRGQRAEH